MVLELTWALAQICLPCFKKKKGNLHVNKDDVDLYTDEKDTYIVVNIKMVGGFNKSGSEDDVVICMG